LVDGPSVRATAQRAAADGHTLVAAGGDGTVSSVASVAIAKGLTFGIIPLGTLNHFARDAGIPTDVDAAVRVLAQGHTVALDVGAMNGRTFLNNASLGIYARSVRERREQWRSGHGKWTAFAIAVARAWLDYRPISVNLWIDGKGLVRRTPFVFIGNGEYQGEGIDVGRRSSLDAMCSGHLSIYVAPDTGRLGLLALSLRILTGMVTEDVTLESFTAERVVVETALRRPAAALDGELIPTSAPIEFVVVREALSLLIPGARP